jgi:hypothetical protein
MSTISNSVNTAIAIIKGDDAEVIYLKYKKSRVPPVQLRKVCRTFLRKETKISLKIT